MISLDELESGQIIGRYRLVDKRGEGTNAEVWRADTFTSVPTVSHAAKLFFGDDNTIASATSEATRLNEISSKHVVQLVDFREFLVVDADSWAALGQPTTPDQLRQALGPWMPATDAGKPGSTTEVDRVLRAYANLAFGGHVDIPDPIIVRNFSDVQARSAQADLELPLCGAALIQTLCRPESLHTYWAEHGHSLSEQETSEIGMQVAEALNAIHSAPGKRPHLDVKLDNVFQLDQERSWLVGDLGLGTARSRMASGERAPWFLALPDLRAHRASDIWLLGLMLHQLATGLLPIMFSGIPLQAIPPSFHLAARELARLRVSNNLHSQSGVWIHPLLSQELGQVIESCLQDDPRARPSAAQIRDQLRALTHLSSQSIPVGPHLHNSQDSTIAAVDAAWILGYTDSDEMQAAGLTVTNDRVPVGEFLRARPAEEQHLSPAELAAQEFAEKAQIRSYEAFKGSGRLIANRPIVNQAHLSADPRSQSHTSRSMDSPSAKPESTAGPMLFRYLDQPELAPADRAPEESPPQRQRQTNEKKPSHTGRKLLAATGVVVVLGLAVAAWLQFGPSDTTGIEASDVAPSAEEATQSTTPAGATPSDQASTAPPSSAAEGVNGDDGQTNESESNGLESNDSDLGQPNPIEYSSGSSSQLLAPFPSTARSTDNGSGYTSFTCAPLGVRSAKPFQAGLSTDIGGEETPAQMITFFGNAQAAQAASNEALISAGDSTCAGGSANRSLYWVPTLYDPSTMTPVQPAGAEVVYQSGLIPAELIQEIPLGLSMVAGELDAIDKPSSSDVVYWVCYSAEENVSQAEEFRGIPPCPDGNMLRQIVRFPQCWNGSDLTSSTGSEHLANRIDASCPRGFDIALPAIRLLVDYRLDGFSSEQLRLASDSYDPGAAGSAGYSAFGGIVHGWDPAVGKRFLDVCITAGQYCNTNDLGDGEAVVLPD